MGLQIRNFSQCTIYMIDKKLFLGNLKSVAQEEAASQT